MLSQKTAGGQIKLEEFKIDPKNFTPNNAGNPKFLKNDHNGWKALQLMCLQLTRDLLRTL